MAGSPTMTLKGRRRRADVSADWCKLTKSISKHARLANRRACFGCSAACALRPGGGEGIRAGALDGQARAPRQGLSVPAEHLDLAVLHALDQHGLAIAGEGGGFGPGPDRRL